MSQCLYGVNVRGCTHYKTWRIVLLDLALSNAHNYAYNARLIFLKYYFDKHTHAFKEMGKTTESASIILTRISTLPLPV